MSDSGSSSEPPDEPPQKESRKSISPWVPISMLAVTTAALAVPLVLLRRQRLRASVLSKSASSSMVTSAPPVRRAPRRGVPSSAPPPHVASALTPASTHSVEASSPLQSSSGASSRVAKEDSFDGALFSLKAFGIATALVVAGGAAGVWGVKTYFGVRDTQEFASAMRLTLLTKWPLLASRIHRASDSAPLPPPISLPPVMMPSAPEPDADPPLPPRTAFPEADGWTWPAAQARLAAAYEHGGVAQFAETAAGELEAEAELERRRRGLAVSSQARTQS